MVHAIARPNKFLGDFFMKRLSRFVLALALLIPPAGLLTGCGQEASKQERAAEDNSYESVENGNAARDVP